MKGALAAVLLVLALAGPAAAQSVTQERLDNGLLVLVRENPLAPVVAISLMVAMGTRWESAENAGESASSAVRPRRSRQKRASPSVFTSE